MVMEHRNGSERKNVARLTPEEAKPDHVSRGDAESKDIPEMMVAEETERFRFVLRFLRREGNLPA